MAYERRGSDDYLVSPEEIAAFERDGYVHLNGVLSDDEMVETTDVYDTFLRQEIPVDGKDFNDVTSGSFAGDPNGYAVVNVMLPRRYYPRWQGNVFERRAASIARQLCGEGMIIDFDQLLAKHPSREDAVFGWHQDQAYWIGTETGGPQRVGWPSMTRPSQTDACGCSREVIWNRSARIVHCMASARPVTRSSPICGTTTCSGPPRSNGATSPFRASCTAAGETRLPTRGGVPTSLPSGVAPPLT